MRRLLACLLVVVGCGGRSDKPAAPSKQRALAGDIAIVGATVVPMNREGVLASTVLLRGDTIVAVAPAADIDTTAATLIDGRGKFVLPGLADMHVHVWADAESSILLLNGVTTVRNLFGSNEAVYRRDAIAKGELVGPTMFTAGPVLDGDPPTWPSSAIVTTPELARAEVRKQKAVGYDLLKVYNSLSLEVYEAIVAEAKLQGMTVVGHVPTAVGLEKVLAAGQRFVEHLEGYMPVFGEPNIGEPIIAATARAETWNCPTLVVMDRIGRLDDPKSLAKTPGLEYISAETRQRWDPKSDFRLASWTPEMYASLRAKNAVSRKFVGDLHRAGARLVIGTDSGNPYVVPGFAVHDELALFVSAGLTPWQAIRAATIAPGELMRSPFGAVTTGSRADLIVVDRDPLVDLAALREPSTVIVRGKAYKRAELLALATAAHAPRDAFAKLPALEVEGTKLGEATFEVLLGTVRLGRERAILSKTATERVVRGQAVYDEPAHVSQFRSTANSLELWTDQPSDGTKVVRKDETVVATPASGRLSLAAAPDAVVAPQTVAEYFWYAERLADLAIGARRTITAVEVVVEDGLRLDAGTFTFTRRADDQGRRSYVLTGKHGELDVSGAFQVAADGLPYQIETTVKWGTFTTKRVP